MRIADTPQLRALERWRPSLFLAAGGILVFYAAFNGLWAFTDMVPEVNGLEIGYVLGFLGLLGMYPTLADRSPWTVRLGAVAAVCGVVAISFISANSLAQLSGLITGTLPGWSVLRFLPLVGFVFGYLLFGVAALRSDVYPKSVGVLVSIPGLIVVLMLVHIVVGYASAETAFVISAGEALAHLAIGASLKADAAAAAQDATGPGSEAEVASDADSAGEADAAPDAEVESTTDD